jgi:hypothetical protein
VQLYKVNSHLKDGLEDNKISRVGGSLGMVRVRTWQTASKRYGACDRQEIATAQSNKKLLDLMASIIGEVDRQIIELSCS